MMDLITSNWGVGIGVLLALHAAASLIVGVTETPRDDQILGKIYKGIEVLAGVTDKTREYPGEADEIRAEFEALVEEDDA